MAARPVVFVACLCLTVLLGGCRRAGTPSGAKPTAAEIASLLPRGASVDEVVYADLTGDGREEALVAASDASGGTKLPLAVILAPNSEGRYAPVFQRRLMGDSWGPIQVGRTDENTPLAAVFTAYSGSSGQLSYFVVQSISGALRVTLDRPALFGGSVRFVPDGLLESRGDVSRMYRWSESGWQPEDLGSQYVPPLPQDTVTIPYFVNQVRGPMIDGPRDIRLRVGQRIFLQRTDTGEPSRILFTGNPSAYSVSPEGVITLLQPDVMEIHIESPAYSGRTLIISVRIDP